MSRKLTFSLILLAIWLVILEGAMYFVGSRYIPDRLLFTPYYTKMEQSFLPDWYASYLKIRDPITGWPLRGIANDDEQVDDDEEDTRIIVRDPVGSRYSPAFPDPLAVEPCISMYGDSFTFSAEVKNAYAWPNILSQQIGCRVNNFGVGGFGSDQAYIRYLNFDDRAPIVFLNHLSENIARNSTQFRTLIAGYDVALKTFGFKPRFIINAAGDLELIETPTIDKSEYVDLLYNPDKYLPYDYFVPDGPSGTNRLRFPYTLSVLGIIGQYNVQAWLRDEPWYAAFYEPGHPSDGLAVTTGIMLAFAATAAERGQKPVLTVIPTGGDLLHFRKHGVWVYQNLLDEIDAGGIDALNFGPGILERLGDRDPCSLFDNCDAHFNEEGYAMLAEIAFEELDRRGLTTGD